MEILDPAAERPGSGQEMLLLGCGVLAAGLALMLWSRRVLVAKLRRGMAFEAKRLAHLESDALTGALSRRDFMKRLDLAVRASREGEGGRPVALALVDLDHFKKLNDSYGHKIGDEALAHLVRTARRVMPGAAVGRLGGDEFALLLADEEAGAAIGLAERLLSELRRPLSIGGRQFQVGASIGVAFAPLDAAFHEELILLADLALYESKRCGRNRVTAFDRDLLKDQKQRRFIERELRAAILMNQLELHYQPVVDAGGAIQGVEALVRWRHEARGLIPPGEFIHIAEESNLIDLLGGWVFRRACLDFAALPGHSIAINVSAAQLQRNEIVAMLTETLERTGRSAREFVLEITENVALTASADVSARIATLRQAGFRIALDDFGTGHCSFNYLKRVPVDFIKIDRSYVSTLTSDPVSRVFVSSLAEIGRLMDIVILAEGVETDEEFALARAAGCTRFQGYRFARPQTLAALAKSAAAAAA